VDIEPGKYVDAVLPAEKLINCFGSESFDVVISTGLLEHVHNWRIVVNNMKTVLKRGGYIYVATRSRGFSYYAYPYDFWRYEPNDMLAIFRDFEIIRIETDWEAPGVFLKARKPVNWKPIDLSNVTLILDNSWQKGEGSGEVLRGTACEEVNDYTFKFKSQMITLRCDIQFIKETFLHIKQHS
jgi:SAM-dependent methyltransferase